MLNNPLPPNFDVPKPMLLRFFPVYVEDFLIVDRAYASKQFSNALHWEIVAILAGPLATNHY